MQPWEPVNWGGKTLEEHKKESRKRTLELLRADNWIVDGVDIRYLGDEPAEIITTFDEKTGRYINRLADGQKNHEKFVLLNEDDMLIFATALNLRMMFRKNGDIRDVKIVWEPFIERRRGRRRIAEPPPGRTSVRYVVTEPTPAPVITDPIPPQHTNSDFDGDLIGCYPL